MEQHKDHVHHHDHSPLKFPEGFLWGAATSAHQVEGQNIQSDWWAWEQIKGHVKDDQVSGKATDHYNRFDEDFALAEQMHHNVHRLSIEWSRIEPQAGEWNAKEIEHYRSVFKSLKARNMQIMLTLHHFTNPQWFAESGGWLRKDAPEVFELFVEKVVKEFGEYVDLWCTINEPNVYVAMGYVSGEWPPQKKSKIGAWRVTKNLAAAHKRAYKKIHAMLDTGEKRAQVGIAQNIMSFVTERDKMIDYVVMRIAGFFWNDYFFKKTKFTHDFIGVNYYFHTRLQHVAGVKFRNVDARVEGRRDVSDLGWEIYAPGLFDALVDLRRYKVPVYITESGIATSNDDKRARYIIQHVKEVYHAIQSGVDVRGYMYWSLLDNFEWHQGYGPRFGLIEVDYATMRRTPRPSSRLLGAMAEQNAIAHHMLRLTGHGVSVDEALDETDEDMTQGA